MSTKYKVIQDQIGRIIIGAFVDQTDTTLSLRNPVILHVQPDKVGQLQVNTFPVFFFELADQESRSEMVWTYAKSAIVDSGIVPDEKLIQQYNRINAPSKPEPTPNIISINDL
jgi:hypothetical protein